jgi:class 3 adenylate cyclase
LLEPLRGDELRQVTEIPDIQFVSVGDADLGFQVLGEGPVDFVFLWGLGSHLILQWELPGVEETFRRLASMCRVILLDRRGTGVSDALPQGQVPTWEEWAEDLGAVLDALESQRAAIMGVADCGPLAIQFAAMHPERVRALVLGGTMPRFLAAPDYPIGLPSETKDLVVELIRRAWGTPEFIRSLGITREDPAYLRAWKRNLCASATPRTAAAQYEYILGSLDVRAALPLVQAPTLVLQYRDGLLATVEHGRYLVEHIPDARLVELPGAIAVGLSPTESDQWIEEILEFVTGEPPPVEVDRVLTTVLFTDIVKSTEHAASLGDRRWRALLEEHDRIVRSELQHFRGREINTTGDGFVASFDGPARAIKCAREIIESVRHLAIEVRAGLHTGECEVRGADLGGLAVHIAARVGALAGPGEVFVSRTVTDLVAGSGIEFHDCGDHDLKGVPGTWRLFAAGHGSIR